MLMEEYVTQNLLPPRWHAGTQIWLQLLVQWSVLYLGLCPGVCAVPVNSRCMLDIQYIFCCL